MKMFTVLKHNRMVQMAATRGAILALGSAGLPLLIECLKSDDGALFRVEDGVCVAGPCAGDALWPWPVAVGADGIIRAA